MAGELNPDIKSSDDVERFDAVMAELHARKRQKISGLPLELIVAAHEFTPKIVEMVPGSGIRKNA